MADRRELRTGASVPALAVGGAVGIALLISIRNRRRGDILPAWA